MDETARSSNKQIVFCCEVIMKTIRLIRGELKDLEAEGAIHCNCNSDGKEETGEYTYRMHHGRVTVECEKCGAMATLPMAGVNSADSFLELTSLTLE